MTSARIKGKDEIGFYSLGGLGKVGMNCYCFEIHDQIFVVDAGILFPDEHLLGVDYVIPDFTYLKNNQEKIVGLFITHGHEDHIGGIPFLLMQVKIPKIYAAGIAIDLILNKLADYKDIKIPEIIEFNEHSIYKFIDCTITTIRLNHSIPDSYGFVFHTKYGAIFHTGDFKFDFTPVGPGAEFDKLADLGRKGCLCMMADSTNATVEGYTKSEKVVEQSLRELFAHIDTRVIVATFASNMYRVQQIISASEENGRKVCVFGRSMEKTIEVGQKIGYIKAKQGTIVDASELNGIPAKELTLLVTGSQGEPLAALSRIANGSHRTIKLIPGDTIIFSSSPIPGNQEGVNKTINQLFKNGCNVITNSPLNDTHASGHASQGDLRLMQNLVRPKYFVPVHGEYRMQKVSTELAIECGVKPENNIIMECGDVLCLTDKSARVAQGKVPAGEIYIDGTRIGDIDNSLIQERRALSDDGLFSVIFTLSESTLEPIVDPQVVSRGFIYMKDSEALTKSFIEFTKNDLLEKIKKGSKLTQMLKNEIAKDLQIFIKQKTDRNPIVVPIFMLVKA